MEYYCPTSEPQLLPKWTNTVGDHVKGFEQSITGVVVATLNEEEAGGEVNNFLTRINRRKSLPPKAAPRKTCSPDPSR